MKKTKLYIAGPMRGVREFNFPAFFRAEQKLTDAGYEVINPARHDTEGGFNPTGLNGTEDCSQYGLDVAASLNWDLTQIATRADGIAVLETDWEKSEGTKLEVGLGYMSSKPIAYVSQWIAWDYRLSGYTAWNTIPSKKIRDRLNAWLRAEDREGFLRDVYKPNHTERYEGIFVSGKNHYEVKMTDSSDSGSGVVVNTDISDSYGDVDGTKIIDIKDGSFDTTAPQTVTLKKGARNLLFNIPGTHGTEEVRTVSASGGEKGVKPARYDLIPVGPLKTVAEHYGVGAKKYADRNWEKGYEWSKSYAAMQRHANQFWGGEDIDEETGSPHLAAVVFHALALLEFANTHPEYDDRPVK